MNCETLSTLYLKANGELVCDDDAGNGISLGRINLVPPGESMAGLLQRRRFRLIRAKLAAGRVPWPGVCERCAFLRPDEPLTDRLGQGVIAKLQIEPSLACNVHCPECSVHEQAFFRPGTRHLPPELLERFLGELQSGGYRLEEMEYCGHGEPLAHPLFSQLCAVTRRRYPQARQRLITNGNFDYGRKVGATPLEEVFVSCDGARPSSYIQYRVGGELARVFRFMRDAVQWARDRGTAVIWKYILFTHNDSDEEIVEAQELAQDIGVTALLFVFTPTRQRSMRYGMENAAAVPRLFSNVIVNGHPSFYRDVRRLQAATTWIAHDPVRELKFCIDEVTLYRGEHLTVTGWAFSDCPVTAIEMTGPQGEQAIVRSRLARPDVPRALPQCRTDRSGFWGNVRIAPNDSRHVIRLRLLFRRENAEPVELEASLAPSRD